MRALVFSKWPSDQFEHKFGEKIRRRGIEIVDVLDPDKTRIPDASKEVDLYISLCELMSGGSNHEIKKAARSSGIFFAGLERQSAKWDAVLGPIEDKIRENARLRDQLAATPPPPPVRIGKEETPPDSKRMALEALQYEKLSLEQELETALGKVKELEALMEGTDNELAGAREAITNLEHELADQTQKARLLDGAHVRMQELENQAARLQEVSAGHHQEIETLRQELDRITQALIERDNRIIRLEADLEGRTLEIDRLRGEYERDGKAYDQLLEDKQRLEAELEQAKQQSRPLRPPSTVKKVEDLRELVLAVRTMMRFGQMKTDEALNKIFSFAEDGR